MWIISIDGNFYNWFQLQQKKYNMTWWEKQNVWTGNEQFAYDLGCFCWFLIAAVSLISLIALGFGIKWMCEFIVEKKDDHIRKIRNFQYKINYAINFKEQYMIDNNLLSKNWKDIQKINELYDFRKDLKDTIDFLKKNTYDKDKHSKITKEQFEENTNYAICTCMTMLEQVDKKIKELKKKK